jgi:hypothetical protein
VIALVPLLIGAGAAASLADSLAHGYQPAMLAMAALTILSAVIAALLVSDQRKAAQVPTPVSDAVTTGTIGEHA